MRKLLGFIFCFAFILISYHLFLITPSYAAGEFETDYKVNYRVQNNGQTQVTQNIILTNRTANFYADKFELKIGSTRVDEVKAQDAAGPLQTDVNFVNNVTTISVKFNQRVVGIDKTLPWTLSYTSSELATKSGQIWEISIPRLSRSEEIKGYTATVSTPTNFGPVAFAVPSPVSSNRIGAAQEFNFSKAQLEQNGIAMSFGEKQVFSFTLDYTLENNNITAQLAQITLPPDNNYQRVVYESINPPPQNVTVDNDNNFEAVYKLQPRQTINVKAKGYVEVFSKPFRNIFNPLTEEEKALYTSPQRYWETDNVFIKEKAAELKTPDKIYDYVASYLAYSKERLNSKDIERKGAAQAVLTPKDSVCMEFTDLFIAIARAAGIPAREVEGYAYTQNERLRPLSLATDGGDILHAWPEYWDDEKGWIQIDPTWGATSGGLDFFEKLDFNHLTFVSRGVSSQNPYPAGSFKARSDPNAQQVFVSFAENLPNITTTPELNLQVPDKLIAGIPAKVKAEVKNVGTSSILGGTLTLSTNHLKKTSALQKPAGANPDSYPIEILPPFSSKDFTFTLQSEDPWKTQDDSLTLSYYNAQITKPIKILPIYDILAVKSITISIVIAFIVMGVGLYLYKRIHHKKLPKPF